MYKAFHLLARFLVWLLTHSFYRLRVQGQQNIPASGGALLVSNHLSFADILFLIASNRRPVRFMILNEIYERPWVKPWARLARAIPVSSELRPRDMIRSLREASESIARGELVCIFAEGQITRIGQLLPFRRGFERIMKDAVRDNAAPIIPVTLDGLWGSIFSFEGGRFLWKLPRKLPYPVTVLYGPPLPAQSTAEEVRQALQDLLTDAFESRKYGMRTLHRAFVSSARRHPFRFYAADMRVPRLSFGAALIKTVFLARRLRPVWEGQEMVGIFLPPSIAGVLVNIAATLMGKVVVNLNYTASEEVIAACAEQCDLKTVVTSKAFLERVPMKLPGKVVLLEDLAAEPRIAEKLIALLMAWTFPARLLEMALGQKRKRGLDDLATVIFSSGSTGDPKGVMLTHYNVGANIEQVNQAFLLSNDDRLLGVLPFFHSFGFTVTLWLPAYLGVSIAYHPNPLEAKAVGEVVARHRVTFMLATPTFLQSYMRRVTPEEFGSLNLVIVGAEKLPARVADAFEEIYGVRPMEGYGCTECAPVVAVNTRDYRAPGFRQRGSKRGSIGRPLPGLTVRVVDPDTREPLPVGRSGLLLVRGPNVMKGYLGHPERTAEVLHDGWYTTGDIAFMDEDGFITITDRLSRFSKIAGEMVPHVKIEDKLHELADASERAFAVTGIPDAKKGERIVVLHTLPEEKLEEVIERLAQTDLPTLWKPRANQFFAVETLPYLGSGKLDLRRVRDLAMELSARVEQAAVQSAD